MSEFERAELERLRGVVGNLRQTFSARHLHMIEGRLEYLENRIKVDQSLGRVPGFKLAEASALRYAIALMRAVLALASVPNANPAAGGQLTDPGGAGDQSDEGTDSGRDK